MKKLIKIKNQNTKKSAVLYIGPSFGAIKAGEL